MPDSHQAAPYYFPLADVHQSEGYEDDGCEEDQQDNRSHASNANIIGWGRYGRNGCVPFFVLIYPFRVGRTLSSPIRCPLYRLYTRLKAF